MPYRGFKGPGRSGQRHRRAEGPRAGRAARFRAARRAARGQGRHLDGRRGRRDRQPRQRAGRFRRDPRARPKPPGTRRCRCSTSRPTRRCSARVYTALYHALMAPSVLSRRRRPLSRARRPDPQGGRLHLPLDLFAVGHVPRRASAADHRPAAIDHQRRRPLAGRQPRGTARTASSRSGSSRGRRPGR